MAYRLSSSASLPVFEETCLAWLRRLKHDFAPEACALKTEAATLINRLRAWHQAPPDPDQRSHTLSEVIELHRRALVYATRKT